MNEKRQDLLTYLIFQTFLNEFRFILKLKFSERLLFGISPDDNPQLVKKCSRENLTPLNIQIFLNEFWTKSNWNFYEWKRGKIYWHIWFFKLSSTNFDLKWNWNCPKLCFLGTRPIKTSTRQLVDKKCSRENLTPLNIQIFLNDFWTKSNWNFYEWKRGKIYWHIWFFKLSPTKFDLKSNWNCPKLCFLRTHPIKTSTLQLVDKNCSREKLTSLIFQFLLNEIWLKIRLKVLWMEKEARDSHIFPFLNFPQRIPKNNNIELFRKIAFCELTRLQPTTSTHQLVDENCRQENVTPLNFQTFPKEIWLRIESKF